MARVAGPAPAPQAEAAALGGGTLPTSAPTSTLRGKIPGVGLASVALPVLGVPPSLTSQCLDPAEPSEVGTAPAASSTAAATALRATARSATTVASLPAAEPLLARLGAGRVALPGASGRQASLAALPTARPLATPQRPAVRGSRTPRVSSQSPNRQRGIQTHLVTKGKPVKPLAAALPLSRRKSSSPRNGNSRAVSATMAPSGRRRSTRCSPAATGRPWTTQARLWRARTPPEPGRPRTTADRARSSALPGTWLCTTLRVNLCRKRNGRRVPVPCRAGGGRLRAIS
mmetsp:Transcript_4706/g.20094  ORF Transcript_4706/g.20094 Transcript_4706/m.20094 type:complete len:287 (+) Transcript_4706:1063-1923(+)